MGSGAGGPSRVDRCGKREYVAIGEAITGWACDLSRWQQVALRMLTETGELTDDQIETLAGIALRDLGHHPQFGDDSDRAVLAGAHLGTMAQGRSRVCLLSVENVAKVNRLARSQVLGFAPEGLTIVYGDNGSGKSGYARVLKRTCGSRCAGHPILPDVYGEDARTGATATIRYQVEGVEEQLDWQDGKEVAPFLPEVGFFDMECAAVELSDENRILLTPPGLDLIQRFAAVCGSVRDRLKTYAGTLDAESPGVLVPDDYAGSKVDELLTNLTYRSDIDALRASVPLTELESARLEELVTAANTDPVEIVKNCRVLDSALETTEKLVSDLRTCVEKDAIRHHEDRVAEAELARKAAELASTQLFANEPLPHVGGDTWKALWEAARSYSAKAAYPGQKFPVVEVGAFCLLCQQPISPEAADRLFRFEQYVADAAEDALRSAVEMVKTTEKHYQDARLALTGIEAQARILEVEDPELAQSCRALVQAVPRADQRFPSTEQAEDLRRSSAGLASALAAKRATVRTRSTQAEEASDPEATKLRNEQIMDLRARSWLACRLPQLASRIEALKSLAAVREAEQSCDTTATSNFAAKVAAEYVTQRLESAFADELELLQIHQLPVILTKSRTQRGSSLHRVQLSGLTCKVNPTQVLSEGEQKCIALAAFLAEISLRQDGSAIIFDDPVTSLDHRWRIEVARRLVGESVQRQVIIFTHDIIFLMALLEEAEYIGAGAREVRLWRSGKEVGLCEDGLPWAGLRVGKRIGVLRNRLQKAGAAYVKEGGGVYEPQARVIYSMLREAWERGVEEVLLNDVVVRMRRSVETKRLRALSDISDGDVAVIDAAMTKCSTHMVGHDEAAGINQPVPLPDELSEDIEALGRWVDAVRQRRA